MQENIINLVDENGVESQFDIILTLEAEGKEYAILVPIEDEDALIFRIDQDEDGEILVPLEDDAEYEIVVDVYNTLMEEEGLNFDETDIISDADVYYVDSKLLEEIRNKKN